MPSGSCMCGNLKYTFTDAKMKVICHCLTCRKISGSSYATTIAIEEPNFFLSSATSPKNNDGVKVDNTAEPESRISKTQHETGMNITTYGCPKCPSTLFKRADGFKGLVIVFAGSLDEEFEEEARPHAEFWTRYRASWAMPVQGATQYEGFPE